MHMIYKHMIITKHTIKTSLSPVAIWKLWEDVNNWNSWDQGVESSSIEGPFKIGAQGRLKPKGGPALNIRLTDVEYLKTFVCESKLPFARIIVSHFLTASRGQTVISHQIEIKGPLAMLFAYLIGRQMKKNLPDEMAAMITKVEKDEKR